MSEPMKPVQVDFPAEIFDVQVNIPLIHQVVVAQQAAARQGSIRAPQFAGGGVVHGPVPRSYDQRTPKKMKAAALRGALSDRARAGRVHVVEGFTGGDRPSTKVALSALSGVTVSGRSRPRTLVVLERGDDMTWLSLRNVPTVHLLAADQLNTYDVLLSDDVVFTRGAFDAFVGGTTRPVDAAPVESAGTESADSESANTEEEAT